MAANELAAMELLFSLLKYAFIAFCGLIGALFVLVLVFGKRVRKRWEFDAEFCDEKGREFGEVDIELSKIEKEESEYTFKAAMKMQHTGLQPLDTVQVLIGDTVILKGVVKQAGRVRLGASDIRNRLADASAGQVCRVVAGTTELARAKLVPD